jgi:hypothetical protein
MKCSDIELWSVDFLANRLDPEKRTALEAHLSVCGACRRMMDESKEAWIRLNGLPAAEPGPALRLRFDAMLADERRNIAARGTGRLREAGSGFPDFLRPFRRPSAGFAIRLALLVFGFLGGFAIRGIVSGRGDVSVLRSEVTEMRRMLTLSLLSQESSAERLRGVQVSRRVEKTDGSVLNALLNTLDGDPSTNVRLAAIDALFIFGDQPRVREALVRSLERQKSPLVQISIIDLLVEIREQKAMKALRFLMRNEKTDRNVRERAEWGIRQLI